MKTAASFFAAVLAFAGLAMSAGAKENLKIKSARICGVSNCVNVTNREKASALAASDTLAPPPPVASFYTVELAIGPKGEIKSTYYYVPSAGLARPADMPGQAGPSVRRWMTVTPEAAAVFREVARGLQPFPKPHLTSVQIGSRTVVDGADFYLRLFEIPSTSSAAGGQLAYSKSIDLRSTQPTPWTDSSSDLSFSPSAGLLARDGQAVPLPEDLLAALRAAPSGSADEGQPRSGDEGGRAAAWPMLVATLAAALVAAAAIAFLLRRARIPRAARP